MHLNRPLLARQQVASLLQPLRHLLEHDFGGAAADVLRARVARHALDRALAHEADAAVKLQAGVGDLVDQLAAIGLDQETSLVASTPCVSSQAAW